MESDEPQPVREESKGKAAKSQHSQQSEQVHRRKTLFDMPVQDNGQFEALTTSALNQAKQNGKKVRQSVLVEGLADFNFDKYV